MPMRHSAVAACLLLVACCLGLAYCGTVFVYCTYIVWYLQVVPGHVPYSIHTYTHTHIHTAKKRRDRVGKNEKCYSIHIHTYILTYLALCKGCISKV